MSSDHSPRHKGRVEAILNSSQDACSARDASGLDAAGLPRFDFGFAFKESTFSDCKLRLHITTAAARSGAEEMLPESSTSARGDSSGSSDASLCSNITRHGEASSSGQSERTRDIPVTAVLLAAKSSFFLKLFTSGFKEAYNRDAVDIHLVEEEEPLFMELLSFIYRGSISPEVTAKFEKTIQLLLLADRFGVEECTSECMRFLSTGLSCITPKDALLILDTPASLQDSPALRPLLQASRACIVEHFGPLLASPLEEQFLRISEAGMRVLLQADDLVVDSEETVFKAVLAWCRHNYEELEERKQVLLGFLREIRLPWMSAHFVRFVLFEAPELEDEEARNIVVDALLCMAEKNDQATTYLSKNSTPACLMDLACCTKPRLAFRPSVRSIFFDIPLQQCRTWTPGFSFQATSGLFCIQGKWFTLNAKLESQKDAGPRFGLFLRLDKHTTFFGVPPENVSCQYRFCVKTQAAKNSYVVIKSKSGCVFSEPYHGWGARDLFRKPWDYLLDHSDAYFPDGAMQFRADIWMD